MIGRVAAEALADAEREMSRRAAHADDEIPARSGARVFHQIADELHAVMTRRLEAERRRRAGQRQVVVNRLRNMRDLDLAIAALADNAGGKPRVVAADGDQRGDAEFLEHGERCVMLLGFRRVRARRAEDGAALEMNFLHVADGQRLDLRRVAGGEMSETVAEADDFKPVVDAFDGGRRDDAVNAGRGTAADQNS